MRRLASSCLLLLAPALVACEKLAETSTSTPSSSAVSSTLDDDGNQVILINAEAAKQMLEAEVVDLCVKALQSTPGTEVCTWQTKAGPQVVMDAEGAVRLEAGFGIHAKGAWTVGDKELPFTLGAPPQGPILWEDAKLPEGVADDAPSVLQITEGPARAGLMLGTDRIIHGFTAGSLAPAAGIEPGDMIVSLNGDRAVAEQAGTFVAALPKTAGASVRIGVSRGGEEHEYTLHMQPYFECHRTWGEGAKQGVVDEPSEPSVAIACPTWALPVFASK